MQNEILIQKRRKNSTLITIKYNVKNVELTMLCIKIIWFHCREHLCVIWLIFNRNMRAHISLHELKLNFFKILWTWCFLNSIIDWVNSLKTLLSNHFWNYWRIFDWFFYKIRCYCEHDILDIRYEIFQFLIIHYINRLLKK